ncbi:calcium homeostasis endoplasmic reticulum protein-like [Artemia franciscana]|uniref:Calcium homeostasis endoplasmic reticulum protein n=1 Tax=Artemia franciscana TaxID=6661 RepID=A0AA88L9X3_ARTSF|nr:hypothetical protein QYM36_002921 [Artemia franciscana]
MDIPQPPEDPELKTIIDKLAQFVARNGPEFELMTKNKQKDNQKFQFLFGGPYFNYYQYKVTTEQAILKHKLNREAHNIGVGGHYEYGSMHHNHYMPGGDQGWGPHHDQMYMQPPPDGGYYEDPGQVPHMDQGPYLGPSFPVHLPPDVSGIESQISELRSRIAELQEQVKQSEMNLAAQHASLMVQQKEQIAESSKKALGDWLISESAVLGIDLTALDSLMQPIQSSCTKDSIASGKAWIFANITDQDRRSFLIKYLIYKGIVPGLAFLERLHLVYLVNDVLHHCVRKNCEELKQALEDAVVPMFAYATTIATPKELSKLEKLKILWRSRATNFSPGILENLENSEKAVEEATEKIVGQFPEVSSSIASSTQSTYEGYHQQHMLFANHINAQIEGFETHLRQLEDQLNTIHEAQTGAYAANGYGQQEKHWDESEYGNNQDWSQPPPMGAFHSDYKSNYITELEGIEPVMPYYDLPAGLMVTMIKADDSSYKSLDPKKIRLPAPVPPSERLIKAVEMFYAPPSHERPRDSEGWEKLALYEYYKTKNQAKKDKESQIEAGLREKSPPRVQIERATTPVPQKVKRRYSSLSPERSPSKSPSPLPSPKKRERKSRSRSPIPYKRKSPSRDFRRSPTPPSFGATFKPPEQRLDESNRGHQLLKKMGWGGAGLGSQEQGIAEPIQGGEVRDKTDRYKGMGVGSDPFEEYRKNRGNQFVARMRNRDEEKKALLESLKKKEGK